MPPKDNLTVDIVRADIDLPLYLFNEGTNYEAYKFLRTQYISINGHKQWRFRCWAPKARTMSVVGDFNQWNRNTHPMTHIGGGVWEAVIPKLKKYDNYKYSIEGADGIVRLKSDPFACHAETAPATASKLCDIRGFKWNDRPFLSRRKIVNHQASPINIYELHLSSWRLRPDGNYYDYKSLAELLVPYIVKMGYTHIELMPITEYPYEGSWGYQISGLFAPTSRFGTPHDFMHFVDICHASGIAVILDFVLSHFPKDAHGLYEFDGSCQYEYSDPLKKEHKSWGTRVFDYSKPEVRSYLISAINFWLEYYHIDGLRLDAVASMLYLDYDRQPNEWQPNKFGGNYNLEAIDFLRQLNTAVLTKHKDVLMIAEESTSFPMVTMPPSEGGLGFNYKWNMGWMNDTLDYIHVDPFFRKGSHNKLTFSITYAFSENYILPFSHDEVVHGKASMISKMAGNYLEKFKALRALYAYQMAHPGKKLNFMGNEFGQFIEWDYKKQLDWILLDFPAHSQLKTFVEDINHLYLSHTELHQLDNSPRGFEWIVVDDNIQNIIIFSRLNKKNETIIVVINFSDVTRKEYKFGVPRLAKYQILLNSNSPKYGGTTNLPNVVSATHHPLHNQKYSLSLDIEGNSALYLKIIK